MNCKNVFQENPKEVTSDLIQFKFSDENLENDFGDIPRDENIVEEIKTDEKLEDTTSAANETEDNCQRRMSNKETEFLQIFLQSRRLSFQKQRF